MDNLAARVADCERSSLSSRGLHWPFLEDELSLGYISGLCLNEYSTTLSRRQKNRLLQPHFHDVNLPPARVTEKRCCG